MDAATDGEGPLMRWIPFSRWFRRSRNHQLAESRLKQGKGLFSRLLRLRITFWDRLFLLWERSASGARALTGMTVGRRAARPTAGKDSGPQRTPLDICIFDDRQSFSDLSITGLLLATGLGGMGILN